MHVDAQHAQINTTLPASFELDRLHKYTQSFNFKCAGLLNQALDVIFLVSEELPHIQRIRVSRYEVISYQGLRHVFGIGGGTAGAQSEARPKPTYAENFVSSWSSSILFWEK